MHRIMILVFLCQASLHNANGITCISRTLDVGEVLKICYFIHLSQKLTQDMNIISCLFSCPGKAISLLCVCLDSETAYQRVLACWYIDTV